MNDWCTLENNDVKLKNYPMQFSHFTYKDALKQQAIDIYENTGIKTIFMSGGIDSQTKALAYILAGIDCKLVFIRNMFEEKSNDLELFYAQEFCRKHKKELTIFEVKHTKDSIEQTLFERGFFTTTVGLGNSLQFEGMKKYMDIHHEDIVTSHGYLFMCREKETCFGEFLKPGFGYMRGLDTSRILLFDNYSPTLYKYYEYAHRNTKEIQFLERYESKNLAYTELGFPFRPKLIMWEFLDPKHDYTRLSTIDWADDTSRNARFTTGPYVILELLGYNQKDIERVYANKPRFNVEDCSVRLYEFETNVSIMEIK